MSVITPPTREMRSPRPYAAIRATVTMAEMSTVLPPLTGEVLAWLAARGEEPAGPELWRYRLIDMATTLIIEAGFPTARVLAAEGRVITGELPGGTYVVTRHHGHPDGLLQATGELIDWAEGHGIDWAKHPEGGGEAWESRLEWYLNSDTPDMDAWDTELAFLTR